MKAQRINHISNLAELGRVLQRQVKATTLGGKTTRLVMLSKAEIALYRIKGSVKQPFISEKLLRDQFRAEAT